MQLAYKKTDTLCDLLTEALHLAVLLLPVSLEVQVCSILSRTQKDAILSREFAHGEVGFVIDAALVPRYEPIQSSDFMNAVWLTRGPE